MPEIHGLDWWDDYLNPDPGNYNSPDPAYQIYGYGGKDHLVGGDNGDFLDGGTGADRMDGGGSSDTYVVDNVGDRVIERALEAFGDGFITGGEHDLVYASITFTLPEFVEDLSLITNAGAINGFGNELENIIHGNESGNTLEGRDGADLLIGHGGNDTLRGGNQNDELYGGEQNDTLEGGAHNDTLDGGTGTDTMRGESGNDDYYVDNAADAVIEEAGQGDDKVFSSISYTLGANVEDLALLDSGGAINGTGNGLDNDIYGNDSDNTLDGGAGDDRMVGNGGNDTYIVGSTSDSVFESANQGFDTVRVTQLTDYTLTANVENLVLGTGRNGTGNALDNNILGNLLDNTIDGGFGNDSLTGGDGIDTVSFVSWDVGQQSAGEVIGIVLGQGSASGSATRTLINFATLTTSVLESDTLSGFENVRGSNRHESIAGNGGNNTLEGRGGDDVLEGKGGSDILDGGDGSDTASYENNVGRVIVTLGSNGADGTAVEFALVNGQLVPLSGDTLRSIENVRGSSFADQITGNAADNILDGRGGADVMMGLTGNDTYVVDNPADNVVEGVGQGTLDRVRTSVSFALNGSEIEVLETTNQSSTAAINLTGNGFGNTITGNNGANVINGGGGADTIDGRGGANTINGGTENDFITADGNLNVANGDEGNDQLYFNGNQNQLFGGSDNDWLGVNGTNNALVGGGGDESWIGASGDSNTLAGQDGNDLLFANGIGNFLFGGNDNDWVGVSGNNNTLLGEAGADYLAATGNNNTLDGGAGNDTLIAAAGHSGDHFVFQFGYEHDIAQGFSTAGNDIVHLESFGLGSFANLQTFMSQVGNDVRISFDVAHSLILQNVQLNTLNAGHFDLA